MALDCESGFEETENSGFVVVGIGVGVLDLEE